MLEILNGNEISMKFISDTDLRLQGEIVLKNTVKTHTIVFKMKSTNPRLFDADPIKNLVQPGQTSSIIVTTTQPINSDKAREISQKNKFLVEYIILEKKIANIQQGLSLMKGPGLQQIKLFINTSSVRASKILKNSKEVSALNTNRYSFHSMAPNTYQQVGKQNSTQSVEQLERLKAQINFLEKKRQSFLKEASVKGKKANGGSIVKFILILILGVVAGNLTSRYSGLQESISQKFSHKPKLEHEQIIQQQQSFFSIFNFGNSQERVTTKIQEIKKPWWKIW